MDESLAQEEVQKSEAWVGNYTSTFTPEAEPGVKFLKDLPADHSAVYFRDAYSQGRSPFITDRKEKFAVVYSGGTYTVEKAS